jgi:uncharacterized membrane protein HdeD (DUF308 family)
MVRWVIGLVLGAIMFAIGLFVALRPLWTHDGVLLGSRGLDFLFALVFMLRGALNVKTALNRRANGRTVAASN